MKKSVESKLVEEKLKEMKQERQQRKVERSEMDSAPLPQITKAEPFKLSQKKRMTEEAEAKRFESLASVVGKALFREESEPVIAEAQEMTITRPMSPKLSQSNRRQDSLKPTE